jgi:hypothetical protein
VDGAKILRVAVGKLERRLRRTVYPGDDPKSWQVRTGPLVSCVRHGHAIDEGKGGRTTAQIGEGREPRFLHRSDGARHAWPCRSRPGQAGKPAGSLPGREEGGTMCRGGGRGSAWVYIAAARRGLSSGRRVSIPLNLYPNSQSSSIPPLPGSPTLLCIFRSAAALPAS